MNGAFSKQAFNNDGFYVDPSITESVSRSGGYLPTIYVDRQGRPIAEQEPVEPPQPVLVDDVPKSNEVPILTPLSVDRALRAYELGSQKNKRVRERRAKDALTTVLLLC